MMSHEVIAGLRHGVIASGVSAAEGIAGMRRFVELMDAGFRYHYQQAGEPYGPGDDAMWRWIVDENRRHQRSRKRWWLF